MNAEDFKPGDVVQYNHGKLDYLIYSPELGLCINACSKSFIESGRCVFGEELYPFFEGNGWKYCKIVGKYGTGSYSDAVKWYNANKYKYI